MIDRRSFLSLGAALGMLPGLRAAVFAESDSQRIPFSLRDGFVTFPLTIAGIARPLVGLLNTGFTISFIDAKRWHDLGGRAIAHAAQRPAVTSDAMRAGAARLTASKIALVDGVDADNRKLGAHADVLIGFDAFAGRALVIDFPNRVMTLGPSPVTGSSGTTQSTKLTYEQYQPQSPNLLTFDGFAFDGTPIAVQFDTMWTGNAILFPTKFAKPPHFGPAASAPRTYEEGKLRAVRVDAVSFTGKPFASNVTAYVPIGKASVPTTRLGGVVGTQLLLDRIVTLDFVTKTIAIA